MSRKSPDGAPLLPAGIFEMPPEKTAVVRRAEGLVLDAFRKWGYQEVRTPALEYVDTLSLGLTGEELDMAFKLVDRGTGKIMALRSDVTPQVARMASLALQDSPLPLRLCYVADVYRHPSDPHNPRREMIQAGVELMGLEDPQADAEVLALGVHALRDLGLKEVRMSVGNVQYARGLLARCSLDRHDEELVVEAACRKDRSSMVKILDRTGVSGAVREAFLALVELTGARQFLDRARSLAPDDHCRSAVDNLNDILDLSLSYGVDPEQVLVDLGDLEAFRYHTGAVFTGYVSGSGRAILKGGRYDGLAGQYGRQTPATGFAIDLLEAVEFSPFRESEGAAIDFLLVNRTGDREKGLKLAVDLRRRGFSVLCLIRDMPGEKLVPYISAHRIARALLLHESGPRVLDPVSLEEMPLDLEDL